MFLCYRYQQCNVPGLLLWMIHHCTLEEQIRFALEHFHQKVISCSANTMTSNKWFSQKQSASTLQNPTAVSVSLQQVVSIGLWASLACERHLHFGLSTCQMVYHTSKHTKPTCWYSVAQNYETARLESVIYTLSLCSYKAYTGDHCSLHIWTSLCRYKFSVHFISVTMWLKQGGSRIHMQHTLLNKLKTLHRLRLGTWHPI